MKKILITLALAALLAVNASATLVLDDFDGAVGQTANSTSNGVMVANTRADALVPGGFRTIEATCFSTGSPACSNGQNAAGVVSPGSISFNLGGNVDGLFRLLYDANGAGLGGFDIAPLGETTLELAVVGADNAADDTQISSTLIDTSANSHTIVLSFPTIPPNDFLSSTLLSGFTGGGVDIHSLQSIALQFDTRLADGNGADFSLNYIRTLGEPRCPDGSLPPCNGTGEIPEPTTLAMMGIGLVGLGLIGRRLSK